MGLVLSFIVLFVLILINGLFVAAEFSIIGVRPSRVAQLSDEGNRTARWVRSILESGRATDRYIATAQLGITLASLGLGMYAEPVLAHLIEGPLHDGLGLDEAVVHTVAFLFSLALITYLHVVVGEMVPKSLALHDPERTVLLLSVPMRMMGRLFSIPVSVLNRIGISMLRLLRVPPSAEASRLHSPDELELIISESSAGGLLRDYERELAVNIFDFVERRVDQVMTHRTSILAIPVTISEDQLLDLATTSRYSRLPVYEGDIDNIVGELHLKDFVRQQLAGGPFDLRSLLRQAPFVPATLPADTLLRLFRRQHQHMAIVIDEHGGTLGLVTLEDLLEEVVGEVRDEFDVDEVAPIVQTAAGHLDVDGAVLLDTIQEYVTIPLYGHDVHTIGGLVLAELERRPKVGDTVTLGDVILRVEEVEGLTVRRVSVRFDPSPSVSTPGVSP
jgi:CBS domain containing-hemolysin-like protein